MEQKSQKQNPGHINLNRILRFPACRLITNPTSHTRYLFYSFQRTQRIADRFPVSLITYLGPVTGTGDGKGGGGGGGMLPFLDITVYSVYTYMYHCQYRLIDSQTGLSPIPCHSNLRQRRQGRRTQRGQSTN